MKHLIYVAVIASSVLSAGSLPESAVTVLEKNCAGCHQGSKAPAGIDLKKLEFNLNDPHAQSLWVRVHDAVREKRMPPGAPLPEVQRATLLKAISAPMIAYESQRTTSQGRSVLRRLNRYEYENTVRDLLAAPWLELRDSLPEDGIVNRFNKVGSALDVSHVQMARYMETAEQALRNMIKSIETPEQTRRFYARDQKRLQRRMVYTDFNRHPERASIPILGFDLQPDVLAQKAPITVGDKDPKTRELEGFVSPAGNYVGNDHHFDEFTAWAGGKYKLKFNVFSMWMHTVYAPIGKNTNMMHWRPDRKRTSKGRTVEPFTIYALAKGGEKRLLGSFDVGPEPTVHELEVTLLPGESIAPDPARLFRSRPGFRGSPHATEEGMPGVAYRWMEVTGPLQDDASKARFAEFFGSDADKSLRAFLGRAMRRPVLEPEVQRYLNIMKAQSASGQREAQIAAYTAVLCSPGFLYMEEKPGLLNSWALANRLSYFLINGPPDAELRALAAKGALARPAVMRAQADRLLDSPKSKQFIDAFLDYWLDLRKLNETTPDVVLYPDYYLDDLLTESATAETQLFFEHVVKKNLPAKTLIASDFTMVNEHLAQHYGLPPVKGVAMRQVALPKDSPRGGLLTQASILKVTANGTTTSPVLRGVWLMERILGDPPPPPPPNVPAVEPDTRGATTIRQQLDKHRSVKSCATCHLKIDPPGFALESFDVLGGWRDRYRSTEEGEPVKGLGKNGHDFTFKLGQPVDASGEMPGYGKFKDIRELKALLASNDRQIARNMVRQFITYATGAPPSFADRAEVERILDASVKDGYGVRTLIHQVVRSNLFTHK
jgi:hypothetical protein